MSSTVMRHQFNINKNSPYDPLVAVRVRLHIDGIFRILMIAHDAAFNAFPIVNVSPYRRGCFAWSEPHKIFSSPKPSRPLHTSSNMSFLCKKKQKQGNGKVANTKLWLDIAWMNDRGWARATQREKKKTFPSASVTRALHGWRGWVGCCGGSGTMSFPFVVFFSRELREGENVAYRLYKAFPANTSLGLDSKTGMM